MLRICHEMMVELIERKTIQNGRPETGDAFYGFPLAAQAIAL